MRPGALAFAGTRALVGCALGASVLVGCVSDRGPRLHEVAPASAPRTTQVMVFGERLCGELGDCARAAGAVRIGGDASVVQAAIIDYADRMAVIQIPEVTPVGKTQLVVTVNELASNALDFEVLAE